MISLLNIDLSVYVKLKLIITIFVDDFHIIGSFIIETKVVKSALHMYLEMSDLRFYKYY